MVHLIQYNLDLNPARIPLLQSNNVASSDIIYLLQSLWLSDQTDNTFGSLGAAFSIRIYMDAGFNKWFIFRIYS